MCLGCPFAFGLLLSPPPGNGLAPSPSTLWWAPLGEWQLFIFWSNFIFTKVMDLKIQFVPKWKNISLLPTSPTPSCSLTLHSASYIYFHFFELYAYHTTYWYQFKPSVLVAEDLYFALLHISSLLYFARISLLLSLLLVCNVLALGMWLWDVIRVQ